MARIRWLLNIGDDELGQEITDCASTSSSVAARWYSIGNTYLSSLSLHSLPIPVEVNSVQGKLTFEFNVSNPDRQDLLLQKLLAELSEMEMVQRYYKLVQGIRAGYLIESGRLSLITTREVLVGDATLNESSNDFQQNDQVESVKNESLSALQKKLAGVGF